MTLLRLDVDTRRLQRAILETPQALDRELNRAVGRIVREGARTARRHAAKAQSNLVNSIKSKKYRRPEGEITAGAQHAHYVELGTGRFGPNGTPSGKISPAMVANLADWIDVKNIEPDDPSMSDADLAWLIAQSIARSGTPQQPFFAPTLDELSVRGSLLMNQAIDRALRSVDR